MKLYKLSLIALAMLGLVFAGCEPTTEPEPAPEPEPEVIPSSFLPTEDQGILFANITMPAGASQKQTRAVANEVQSYFEENEKDNIEGVMAS